jgi:hypothetical protein
MIMLLLFVMNDCGSPTAGTGHSGLALVAYNGTTNVGMQSWSGIEHCMFGRCAVRVESREKQLNTR